MPTKPVFVISLDFELYWGVRDKRTLAEYGENLLGVRNVVPALLDLFSSYGIHATWATVGFLFFESKEKLIEALPSKRPRYDNEILSPYKHIETIGPTEEVDPYHYAPSLIRLIQTCPYQEIGTHTFSHYYCLETGQSGETFGADLSCAVTAAKGRRIDLKSMVFPRNQVNPEYMNSLVSAGIKAFRGNEVSWIYAPRNGKNESTFRRAVRFMDSYVNISGDNSYSFEQASIEYPFNLRSSSFLRPWSRRLQSLEPLRMKRIQSGMSYAAQHGNIYHLWWHPHNFGVHQDRNIAGLRRVLDHYVTLRDGFGMESLNMGELAEKLSQFRSSTGPTFSRPRANLRPLQHPSRLVRKSESEQNGELSEKSLLLDG